jgi:hypothetical protein
MQILNMWKAGQVQAGAKCAQRKENGARQRTLPQTEDVGEKPHNLSLYRGGAGESQRHGGKQMASLCRHVAESLRNGPRRIIHSVSPFPHFPRAIQILDGRAMRLTMHAANSAEAPLNPGIVFEMLNAYQRTAALKAAIELEANEDDHADG